MTTLLGRYAPTQRRALEALLRAPDGLAVEQLAARLAITPSAVRQLLAGLERDGVVGRGGRQATAGRPQTLFVLTPAGREAFPRSYGQLAEALLTEVAATMGERDLERLMHRIGARAARDGSGGRTLTVAQAASALKGAGYAARVDPDDATQIVAHNCVFHRLAARHPAICRFDIGFVEAATGAKVEHRECMVRGGHVCRFALRK